MGFDLYALKPKTDNEEHSYFRSNVWYWRPLWSFVELICNDEISKLNENIGQYNDGDEVPDNVAIEIGKRLNTSLKNGTFKKFQDHFNEKKKSEDEDDCSSWYNLDYELTESFSDFCLNSGGFSIC